VRAMRAKRKAWQIDVPRGTYAIITGSLSGDEATVFAAMAIEASRGAKSAGMTPAEWIDSTMELHRKGFLILDHEARTAVVDLTKLSVVAQ
jgi:hypothetical protein